MKIVTKVTVSKRPPLRDSSCDYWNTHGWGIGFSWDGGGKGDGGGCHQGIGRGYGEGASFGIGCSPYTAREGYHLNVF